MCDRALGLLAGGSAQDNLLKNAPFVAALKALAQKYQATKYGRMAAADATRVGG